MADRISNNPANFEEGGIYGGGTNIATSVKYTLWDYNGTQPPDSNVAVLMKCQPTDGSNEGKPHDVYWNVGPATEFRPDHTGGSLIPVHTRTAQSKSSNWSFALIEGFVKNCGLDPVRIDGPDGITVMDGSEFTLARVDPPKREGLQEAAPAPGQPPKRGPNKILIPTKASWVWEDKSGRGRAATAPAGPSAASRATMGQTVAANEATASAGANGAGAGSSDQFTSILTTIMTASGGSVELANLAQMVGEQCALQGIGRADKIKLLKDAKNLDLIKGIAAANNWTHDAADGLLIS